jgi:hypothetical protein
MNLKHGMSQTREYEAWSAMIQRCETATHPAYARYGGRGIRVCPEWRKSFKRFFSCVGLRPDGASLERKDNDRGYEPGNVHWATPKQQAHNRANSVVVQTPDGTMPLAEYAERLGITFGAAFMRLKRNTLEGCRRHEAIPGRTGERRLVQIEARDTDLI